MHIPKIFRETDSAAMCALIGSAPLATLLTHSSSGLCANHIPLLWGEKACGTQVLRGHIARANPLAQFAGETLAALAVFHGPESYISPAWYPAKREHGRVVPTWNYVAVHAHGSLQFISDETWLRDQLRQLTEQQEAESPQPWSIDDAPADYLERLARAIVGVEFTVEKLEGKRKLSQNQDPETQQAVVRGLRQRKWPGDEQMAAAMAALIRE